MAPCPSRLKAIHKIYSHPDTGVLHLLKNELEQHGIEAVTQGEHLTGVAGGGAAWNEAWHELWIEDEDRLQDALRIVHRFIQRTDQVEQTEHWICPDCGETVEAQFAMCWKCGHEAPKMS